MVAKLKIAIVGRPNVGKSSLFNRICGRKVAIVDEMEGVTRDRLYREADCFGYPFTLIDTGGIDFEEQIPFHEEVKRQAEVAISEADLFILVVDGLVGPTQMDKEIALLLLRSNKTAILAVNKCDQIHDCERFHEFHSLGISKMFPVSAAHGHKTTELIEACISEKPDLEREENPENQLKIAIIGKPNVGKSTLLNQLLEEERSIVSPIPGTTRDQIDSEIVVGGKLFLLIDTAGIRRKRAEHEVVDKYAAIRTERAIERCDICLLMLDATEGITKNEKKIARFIDSTGKGCIIFLNKWDLVKGIRMEHCVKGLALEALFLKHCPVIIGSAKEKRNISKIFDSSIDVFEKLSKRISTGKLNRFMEGIVQKCHPPMIDGRRLRIYYLTQVSCQPPHFLLFVNYPDLMTDTYKKYILNQFRAEYDFSGCPLIFEVRQRARKDRNTDWSKKEKETIELLSTTS